MSINRKRDFKIQMPVCPYCGAVCKHYGWQCPENPKNKCTYCGKSGHTSLMCQDKPRVPLSRESAKSKSRRIATRYEWLGLNPPNEKGLWFCYLRISPDCPYKLTRSTLRLEHVKSKVRYPELKYDVNNLRPACDACNSMKGSLDLDELHRLGSVRLPEGKTWADVFEAAGVDYNHERENPTPPTT